MGYSQVVAHEARKQRICAARGLQAGVALVARAGQLLLGAGPCRVRMPLHMPHAHSVRNFSNSQKACMPWMPASCSGLASPRMCMHLCMACYHVMLACVAW